MVGTFARRKKEKTRHTVHKVWANFLYVFEFQMGMKNRALVFSLLICGVKRGGLAYVHFGCTHWLREWDVFNVLPENNTRDILKMGLTVTFHVSPMARRFAIGNFFFYSSA